MQHQDSPARRAVLPWIIAGLASVVAVGALIFVADTRHEASGQEDAALAQVSERLDALESRGGAAQQRFMPQPMPATAGQMAGSPAKTGLPPLQAMDAQAQSRLRNLESRFSQQPPDPAAPQMEVDMLKGMVDGQLGASGIVPKNPKVDCKRDVCRIVADFRSQADASEWAIQYVTLLGPAYSRNAQPAFVANADGSVQMHLFANR